MRRNTALKTLFIITVAVLLFGTFGTVAYGVGNIGDPCFSNTECKDSYVQCINGTCEAVLPEGPGTPGEVVKIIGTIGNWVFAFFLALSVIYIIIAAFQCVTGGPEGVSEARQKLMYAAIGIAIALFAGAFDNIISSIILNA